MGRAGRAGRARSTIAAAGLWALGAAAFGAPPTAAPVADGTFVVGRADAEVVVHAVGMPEPVVILPEYRVCRVSVGWDGASARWRSTVREGCHPNLLEAVVAGADAWNIEITHPPARDRELFEYWYVFPDGAGEPVRVFVRQAYDQQLVLTAPDLDVLDWSIKARVPLTYPAAAAAMNTDRTACQVKIDVAPSGTPGEIVVTDCDDVFVPSLKEALQRWRFGTPELDGVPFYSGFTVGVRFRRNVDGDDPPGFADPTFPPDPEMGNAHARVVEPVAEEPDPVPPPTWDPLFVVDHRSYAEIGVYDVRWPEPPPADAERTCDVLFQVNSARRVWVWPETCDPTVRDEVIVKAGAWLLQHGTIEPGERLARFRGTFVFPADGGHAWLRVPEEDLETPSRDLPEYVTTYTVPKADRTFPPRLPRTIPSAEGAGREIVCEMSVRVDPRGRPAEVTTVGCPEPFAPFATKAVEKWRWIPAQTGGEAIESQVTVRIRFDLPPPTEG